MEQKEDEIFTEISNYLNESLKTPEQPIWANYNSYKKFRARYLGKSPQLLC